uniref:BZIP domain-containing protein n=1 Tax=Aegilops tauschii subsp. strangulata TaxID=200361 RepID=A0A453LHE9_AEGTS
SRSRARKQAHVTQIESEVHQLREENEQLRLNSRLQWRCRCR